MPLRFRPTRAMDLRPAPISSGRRLRWSLVAVVLAAVASLAPAPAAETVFQNVRVFDGERILPATTVVIKDGLIKIEGELKEVSKAVLGTEGKRAIRAELSDIRSDISNVRSDIQEIANSMHRHETEHAVSEGRRTTIQSFWERYAAPIITGLIVGAPALIIAIIALTQR